jgi:hypothetical protein
VVHSWITARKDFEEQFNEDNVHAWLAAIRQDNLLTLRKTKLVCLLAYGDPLSLCAQEAAENSRQFCLAILSLLIASAADFAASLLSLLSTLYEKGNVWEAIGLVETCLPQGGMCFSVR